MTLPKRSRIDTEETPIEERVQKALKHYRRCLGTKKEISIRKAAKLYGIKNWERLRGRLHEARPREDHSAEMQRLIASPTRDYQGRHRRLGRLGRLHLDPIPGQRAAKSRGCCRLHPPLESTTSCQRPRASPCRPRRTRRRNGSVVHRRQFLVFGLLEVSPYRAELRRTARAAVGQSP